MARKPVWRSHEFDDLGKEWIHDSFPEWHVVPITNHRWGTEHLIGWEAEHIPTRRSISFDLCAAAKSYVVQNNGKAPV